MNTNDNLKEAFAGESQANQKYRAFAKKAEQDGFPNVARLFRTAAEAERIHADGHLRALDGIGAAETNAVAVLQRPLGDLLAVDERAIARAAIAQREAAVLLNNLGMFARDVGADDLQIGGRAPADQKQRAIEHDDASSLRVADVEAGFGHRR